MIRFFLPMPPSINHYYGNKSGGGKFIKPAGVAFRHEVARICMAERIKAIEGRICLTATFHFATRAKNDLDNRMKAAQDALTFAGVWKDDSQIDELHVLRGEVIKCGRVVVEIKEIA